MFLIINIDIIIIKRLVIIFGNFRKYAISDCLFIILLYCTIKQPMVVLYTDDENPFGHVGRVVVPESRL